MDPHYFSSGVSFLPQLKRLSARLNMIFLTDSDLWPVLLEMLPTSPTSLLLLQSLYGWGGSHFLLARSCASTVTWDINPTPSLSLFSLMSSLCTHVVFVCFLYGCTDTCSDPHLLLSLQWSLPLQFPSTGIVLLQWSQNQEAHFFGILMKEVVFQELPCASPCPSVFPVLTQIDPVWFFTPVLSVWKS